MVVWLLPYRRRRRRLLWFAATRHPTAEWLAQQMVEAFPWNTAPTYLVRDNDGAYGQAFTRRLRTMGFATAQRYRDRRGRMHMLSASSGHYGASAWIMF